MSKLNLSWVPAAVGVSVWASLLGCTDGEPGGGNLAPGSEVDARALGDAQSPALVDASVGSDAQAQTPLDPPSGLAPKQLPCEVKAILERKCGACHGATPAGGAPSFTLASAFQGMGSDQQKLYLTAKRKLTATDPREAMPPAGQPDLTETELATLLAWLERSAPGVADVCKTDPAPDAGAPDAGPVTDDELECHKLLAHGGGAGDTSKFKVGVATDAYMMWVFDPPWKQDAYGIVVRPVIDNAKALHHWLLYQDVVPTVATGAIPQIGAHPTGQLIAGWAPGTDPMDFRQTGKDVGLELPASTTYTLEVHYNSNDPSAEDASGVEVCTTKRKVQHSAAYSWVGSDNLVIPSDHWIGRCSHWSSEPVHIVAFFPHMHLKGTHMTGTVFRKDGSKQVVHDQDFDFNFQRTYMVDVTLNPGDTLQTDCYFSEPMLWGQPTTSEMCYLFAMAYPRGALSSPDIWGAVAHGGSSCLGM
jgi:mono/diheme cytochrome c family protein